jgi:hypothetical protein
MMYLQINHKKKRIIVMFEKMGIDVPLLLVGANKSECVVGSRHERVRKHPISGSAPILKLEIGTLPHVPYWPKTCEFLLKHARSSN